MINITVIIINYKTENIILDTLNSIQEEYINISILILDNASTEKSLFVLEKIKNNNENVELLTSTKNLGFDNGVNYAFTYLLKNDKYLDYIFLINPDVLLEKNIIYNLYNILKKYPNTAAISPNIINLKKEIQYSGWQIDWKKCVINIKQEIDDVFYTDVFHGCTVLIDAKKFLQVSMFSDNIFMYYDEAFLSMNFASNGYKILATNKYKSYHLSASSLGDLGYLTNYYHTRNHLLFFKKYSQRSKVLCKYKNVLIHLLSSIKHLHFKKFSGEIRGLYDYWRHRTGKIQ